MIWLARAKKIIFTAPAKAVRAEVDKLTKAGINKIILLSHSGFDIELDIDDHLPRHPHSLPEPK